jgi:hypothetical protein
MKRLVMGQGMDAVRAIGEFDYSISGGGLHGRTVEQGAADAKLKERARTLDRIGAQPSGCRIVEYEGGPETAWPTANS